MMMVVGSYKDVPSALIHFVFRDVVGQKTFTTGQLPLLVGAGVHTASV